jgi:transglutaminase-like putative cysteine protease
MTAFRMLLLQEHTMRFVTQLSLAGALGALLPLLCAAEPAAKKRSFLFTYSGAVTGLKPGDKARVWLPVPPTNEDQEVRIESGDLPAPVKEGKDPQYGNAIVYFEGTADKDGNVLFERTYRVTRREVKGAEKDSADANLVKRFLQPDKLVPIDGKPLELIKDRKLPKDETEAAKVLYEVVNANMKYDKTGTGWGRGDSVWACENKHGNCTDFHSLFISLARANKIPAKFEIGFGLPEKRGGGDVAGYHCWAKFRVEGQGWVPVDISEANKDPKKKDYYFGNLSEDRVAFSTGRDITLSPKQDGEPLNYFVYPYVEVGGKPYPADKVRKKFSYKDVD